MSKRINLKSLAENYEAGKKAISEAAEKKALAESFEAKSGEVWKLPNESVMRKFVNGYATNGNEITVPAGTEVLVVEQPRAGTNSYKVAYNNTMWLVDPENRLVVTESTEDEDSAEEGEIRYLVGEIERACKVLKDSVNKGNYEAATTPTRLLYNYCSDILPLLSRVS